MSVVAAFAMVAPAAQAASWSVQGTPNPLAIDPGALGGVSCSSASACTAVGSYTESTGTHATLAEAWNGSSWKIEATPNPGAKINQLSGVSCSSASACTAVGYYVDSTGTDETFVEVWNGSSWKIESSLQFADGSQLSGVSCSSASACTAVGYVTNGSGTQLTFAEAWNGSSWELENTPNPAGALFSVLTGVSCSSASACTAVGYYDNSGDTPVTLAEAWNGTSWKIESTPNPTGSGRSFLNGVSCSSPSACTTVGEYDAGTYETLAEAWNGKSWKIESTPNAAGGKDSQLNGVSCTSPSACIAVGYYGNSGAMLAEEWNGSSWKLESTPKPTGGGASLLNGVWCRSASACTAVGAYTNTAADTRVTLAEVWNGSSWLVQSTANRDRANNSQLSGVSCSSASACTAIGYDFPKSTGPPVTLAEAWNGTSWKIESTPALTDGGSQLSGVSCTSARACTAVGDDYGTALAEAWNGTSWKIESTPTPTGGGNNFLSGVSCTSASACTAVGSYANSANTFVTLAEVWNGTSWKIESTPNRSGAQDSRLTGVSCPSASACTAVGYYEDSASTYVTLAEVWNGSSWKFETTPNPAGGSRLAGVSCTSASACTAVGQGDVQGDGTGLAEVWNGSSWKVQSTSATLSFLNGVWCTAASACTAVGEGGGTGLAEVWNGTSWQVQSTPNPNNSAQLNGVSCTSASACTAAGAFGSGGIDLTLAERYS